MTNNPNPNSKEKEFDTVKFFREVKTKIAVETKGMSFPEFKEYLNRRKLKLVKWESNYKNVEESINFDYVENLGSND